MVSTRRFAGTVAVGYEDLADAKAFGLSTAAVRNMAGVPESLRQRALAQLDQITVMP